jgi:indolepyruvate ferredoxin oxidoreductase
MGQRSLPHELSDLLVRRTAQVIDYQSAGLARRFLDLVERAAARDSVESGWALTRAITEGWFKLLTYKDEYEVARLHAATNYDAIARDLGIEGAYTLSYHLHPPILRRMGMNHKLPMGKPYAFAFRLLRRMKHLRGTPFDPFGRDPDRRLERAVAQDYERMVCKALGELPYDRMVELAASAGQVKGYGPVKERNVAAWRARVADLRYGANRA